MVQPAQKMHGHTLIPPAVTFQWTLDLFIRNLTSSNASIIKVLQDLPLFLHICPQVPVDAIKQPFLLCCGRNLMQSSLGSQLLIPMCRAITQLCCVFSKTTELVRPGYNSQVLDVLEDLLVFLVESQDRTVAQASVSMVPRYFNHYGHTLRSLTACLQLASHSDFEVRFMFRENRFVILALVCLIKSHLSSSPYLLALAKRKLSILAENQNLRLQELCRRFKIPICQSLAKLLIFLDDMDRGIKFLNLLSDSFGSPNFNVFLKMASGYILRDVAINPTVPFSSTIIKALASHLGVPVQELILDNFQYIFPFLLIHCTSSDHLKQCLAYMEEESGVGVGMLLRWNFQPIHNELLRQLSSHYQEVFTGLAMLAENFKEYHGPRPITTPEQMSEFLNPRMLGYITFFDSQLVSLTATLEEKKQILNSLARLMDMMGPQYITATRMKLMATLRITLRYTTEDFPQITCKLWKEFVHSIEDSALRTTLLHVVVALIPHLELYPEGVAKIFRYLILEKREVLSDSLGELYFIPDIPELEEVNAVLKHYTHKVKQSGFHLALNHYKKGLNHENLEVRLQALVKIKDHLAIHHSGYDPANIYNADETGLFFKLIPDRTLAHKDENCRGAKRM
ncbi:ATR [Cordylochernes scorpioides]|uniref:ATR n=1 Tax=Cordylochernes scorpioides TaxID=51811 RepID=A0ABY6L1U9_9ARAC|nr:ATR [Cordylochernes scorpioides]